MDIKSRIDAMNSEIEQGWAKWFSNRRDYFISLSDQILASYITITEHIGNSDYPFPPDNTSTDRILNDIKSNAKPNRPPQKSKKSSWAFFDNQMKLLNSIATAPISSGESYFIKLYEGSRCLAFYFNQSISCYKLSKACIDTLEISNDVFERSDDALAKASNKTQEKPSVIIDKLSKVHKICLETYIELAPPNWLLRLGNDDYRIIARFQELKGLWSNKVAASRRGRKAAAVRTDKHEKNLKMVEKILSKYDFEINNRAIAEAMLEIDRGEKTVKNMIKEILQKEKTS